MQLLMRQLFTSVTASVILSGSIGCQHICHRKSNLPPIDCSETTSKAQPVPPPHVSNKVEGKESCCTICQKSTHKGEPCPTCAAPLPSIKNQSPHDDLKILSPANQPKKEVAETKNPVSPNDPNAPENLPFPPGFDAPYPLDVPIEGLSEQVKNHAAMGAQRSYPPQSSTKGHAANYSWLIGDIFYSHISKEWRVRYLGLDQSDEVGGSVALQGAEQWLDEINKGGLFRITGQMHKLEKGYIYEVISIKRAN